MLSQRENVAAWGPDWAWGVPIIVANVVFHAYVLGLIHKGAISRLSSAPRAAQHSLVSALVVSGTALSVTVLHAAEVIGWGVAYRLLGAAGDNKYAMLYSLNAMTSYGHVDLYLQPRWQMLGALEALNGWILFGLTTAFLFAVVQKAWLPGSPPATNC